jgi:hypothetical protein
MNLIVHPSLIGVYVRHKDNDDMCGKVVAVYMIEKVMLVVLKTSPSEKTFVEYPIDQWVINQPINF